ncbi:MAG TPA: hypothetical protein PLG57_03760 [Bacteroidia bacterium]|jgi:hypothetical protein|nr:hypothetical protein [Bacteroidia bacterium]HQF28498.1 hypothetical protein [Bacteroidia bacterium]HQK97436.1 hypothetical protein [Bacteroidia bacterium]
MRRILGLIKTIKSLPKANIQMDISTEEGLRMYKYYTKPHPKVFLVKNKTLGVALIKLNEFKNFEQYVATVSGKNSAAYYSRRCEGKGYQFKSIDPDTYALEIDAIHKSSNERQGKQLSATYLKPILKYPKNEQNRYYGIFSDNKLVAYLWTVQSGELMTLNRLMGHNEYLKDGIMYLLVLKAIDAMMLSEAKPSYVMYDTMLGASEGLLLFKKRLGFQPNKVNWKK